MPRPNQDVRYDHHTSESSGVVTCRQRKFEKRGQKIDAALSIYSPNGSRKRLVFEDLTNSHRGAPSRPKKKPTVVFIDDTSSSLAEYHLILSSSLNSFSSDSSVDNSFFVGPITISQTSTANDPCLTERSFASKEKVTGQEATLCKKTLLPSNLIIQELDSVEEPLTLLEETGSYGNALVENLSITGEKHTLVEESGIKKKHSVNMCKNSANSSCQNEEFALQVLSAKEGLVSAEPKNFEKSKTEIANSTKKSLILQNKHAIQENVSSLDKPLTVKSISEEKLLIKSVTLKKKPTAEKETSFQSSSALQEKHATVFQASAALKEKMSVLKNPDKLQEGIESDGQFVKESLSFRKKYNINEAVSTKETSLTKKGYITQTMMITHQKVLDLRDVSNKDKNSHSPEPESYRKSSTKEATVTKASVSLKEQQGVLYLEKTTSEEKSLCKSMLHFKEKSSTEDLFLPQNPAIVKENTTLRAVSLPKNLHTFQEKASTEKESSVKKASTLQKKPTVEKKCSLHVISANKDKYVSRKTLPIHEKTNIKEKSWKKFLTFSEENTTREEEYHPRNQLFSRKTPIPDVKQSKEKQLYLKKNDTDLLKNHLALQDHITNEERAITDHQLVLKENPLIENQTILQKELIVEIISEEPLATQDNLIPDVTLCKESLTLQERPEERAITDHQLVLKENPVIENQTILQKEFIVEVISEEPLATQDNLIPDVTLCKESLTLQERPEERVITDHQLVLKENPIIENQTILQKEFIVEVISEDPLATQDNLIPDVILCKESLTLQERPTVNKAISLKEALVLNENPTTSNMLTLSKPLTGEENPIHMKDSTISDLLPQTQTNPNTAIRPHEYRARKPRVIISNMNKFSFISKSCIYDSDNDPVFNTVYAKDIFRYMKEREEKFKVNYYMPGQADVNSDMRAILVDWMVELQVTFEMSHETLYLAVKLVDLYLMAVICRKEKLQLVGSTAFLIAAKFEEPRPPCLEDFLYICDEIYSRHEMINMEMKVLKTLNFDINIPVAYQFLRAYAKFVPTDKQTVSLSRFICELTLQNYAFIEETASKLATASFLLALYINNLKNKVPELEKCSGYKICELHSLVLKLNILLSVTTTEKLKNIKLKYSHKVFFEVARTPALNMLWLKKLMESG